MMENGKLKAWFPTIKAGSGADFFVIRLAEALTRQGIATQIDWFPLRYEVMPSLLQDVPPPAGTDIIFTNSWNGFAFKRQNIPLVVTSHHPEFTATGARFNITKYIYHRLLIRSYEKRSFEAADLITADSFFTAQSLQETRFANKVQVAHLWVDNQKFSPAIISQKKNRPAFRLLFVGTLSYRKGADLLAPIMRNLGNDFHLDIVGKVSDRQSKNFPSNISILGKVSDGELIDAYRHCDALLFPSRWEGFGYTALEAMACGKPVVTSNAASLPEVVTDGVTGILCPPGDIQAFVTACKKLATDQNLAHTMGNTGRQHAINLFSEDKLVLQYMKFIEQLCAASSSRQ